jgi:hypothetical protein
VIHFEIVACILANFSYLGHSESCLAKLILFLTKLFLMKSLDSCNLYNPSSGTLALGLNQK